MRQALDKISTQILRFIPLLLGVLVPLFFLPFTADFFAFNKFFLVALIASISLIAWCLRNLTRGKLHYTASPALLPLLFLIIANIVSSIWLSPTTHTSLLGQTSLFISLTLIFFAVTSSQKNSFVILSLIYGLITSASLLNLFSLVHFLGLTTKIFSFEILTNRLFNPSGGVLPALVFTLPLLVATISFTLTQKRWIVKSLLFASVILMITGSVINLSLIMPQGGTTPISLLPVRAGWSIVLDTLKNWQTALLGTGPETFFSAFTRFRPSYLNLDPTLWNIRFAESSNYIFTLLTTTGILGTLTFIAAFTRLIVVSFKSKENFEDKTGLGFFLSALVLNSLLFFLIPTGIVTLTLEFLLLIGLTIILKLNNSKHVKDVTISLSADSKTVSAYKDISETADSRVFSAFLPWMVLALAVIVLSAFWAFASKIYLGSVAYKQATNLSQANPYGSFLSFQKAAKLDTHNPYYTLKLSQIYLAVADSFLSKENSTDEDKKQGANYAQLALDAGKISAKQDTSNVLVWENLFSTYRSLIPYAQGSVDMTISHALQAISLDRSNPTLYLQLGVLFYNLGDADQAIKFLDRAVELKQNWNLPYFNLSGIYKAQKNYAKALQYAQAGLQYTSPEDESLPAIQEEIKSLEKLAPNASASGTLQP